MIEQFDFEELAGSYQISRHANISVRWCGITAWMIMHENDGRGACNDGQAKYLSWVNENRIHGPDGNEAVAFDSTASIHQSYHQTFTLGIEKGMSADVFTPVSGGA